MSSAAQKRIGSVASACLISSGILPPPPSYPPLWEIESLPLPTSRGEVDFMGLLSSLRATCCPPYVPLAADGGVQSEADK